MNISRYYRKTNRAIEDATFETTLTFLTRRTEYSTRQQTMTMYTTLLERTTFHPETKETAFQILNRTTWINNKAHKSGTRDNPK
jgi:hypothetical protein